MTVEIRYCSKCGESYIFKAPFFTICPTCHAKDLASEDGQRGMLQGDGWRDEEGDVDDFNGGSR